jgi:diguanylate cyclase (GGDEF)-like protein
MDGHLGHRDPQSVAWHHAADAPTFLVVDDDERVRAMVRFALELEGLAVIEAGSLVQARTMLGPDVTGIVLDRQLPDGDGLDLLPDIGRLSPGARVVVCSALNDGREPEGLSKVDKSDMTGLVTAFGLGTDAGSDLAPVTGQGGQFADAARFGQVVRDMADALVRDWIELCKWDPELAVDATPTGATEFVDALADALDRPQPLGWGLDPAIERASTALAAGAPAPAAAIAQLVCLREALHRRLDDGLAPSEARAVQARATMALERGMACVTTVVCRRLEEEVFVDVLTRLPNRRALDRDLARQLAWADRSRTTLTLVLVNLDGLKLVNTSQGRAAGDASLCSMADALAGAVRAGDGAYRLGGDEFLALLPDSPAGQVPAILRRAVRLAAPPFSWGVATYPSDGRTAEELVDAAYSELARRRHGDAEPSQPTEPRRRDAAG